MKTKITLLFALFAGILFAGCVASSDELNNIRIGMTKAEVISLLGKPNSMSAQANVEDLTYYLEADTAVGYGRDQPYLVRLVDGKVESFGRFAQLYDLYNRPVTNALPGQPGFPQGALAPGQTQIGGGGTVVIRDSGQSTAPKPDIALELMRLKALKDQGVLTDDEFQKAKEKILAQP